jgi:hypothetical protein
MIDQAIADVKNGSFEAKDYGVYAFMEYGGSSMVVDEELAGAAAVEAAKAVEASILDGSFTVEINDSEPTSTQ